jgi:hypothetical protein
MRWWRTPETDQRLEEKAASSNVWLSHTSYSVNHAYVLRCVRVWHSYERFGSRSQPIDQVEYMRFVCCPVVQIKVYEVVTSAAGFCRTIFCVASGCGCGRDRTPPSDNHPSTHFERSTKRLVNSACLPCFNCCMDQLSLYLPISSRPICSSDVETHSSTQIGFLFWEIHLGR